MRYKLEDKLEQKLRQPPTACSLRFRITDATGRCSESIARCWAWHLGRAEVHVAQAKDLNVPVSTATILRIALVPTLMQGKGVWIPKQPQAQDFKTLIRSLAPEAKDEVKEIWIPKSLHSGSALIKCQAAKVPLVLARLTEAGFSVVPNTEYQNASRVIWLKEVHSWEQASEAAEQLLEESPQQCPLQDCTVLWTKESALFAKDFKGTVSWGLRLPAQQADAIAKHTGKDIRKVFKLYGAPRVWMQEDLAEFFKQLKWNAQPMFANRAIWTVRASTPPARRTVTVRSGYEQATIRIEEESTKTAISAKKPVDEASGKHTWASLLKAKAKKSELPMDTPDKDQVEWSTPCLTWQVEDDDDDDDDDEEDDANELGEDPRIDASDDAAMEEEPLDKKRKAGNAPSSRDMLVEELRGENAGLKKQLQDLTAVIQSLQATLHNMQYAGGQQCPQQQQQHQQPQHTNIQQQMATHSPPIAHEQPPMQEWGLTGTFVEIDFASNGHVTYAGAQEAQHYRVERAKSQFQMTVQRGHWQAMLNHVKYVPWTEVGSEGNLCFWLCLGQMLVGHHDDAKLSAQELKDKVITFGHLHAAELAKDVGATVDNMRKDLQTAQVRGALANEKCVQAAALMYGLNIAVLDWGQKLAWTYLHNNADFKTDSVAYLWLARQHFWVGQVVMPLNNIPLSTPETATLDQPCYAGGGKPAKILAAITTAFAKWTHLPGDWSRAAWTEDCTCQNK
eukprot:757613-Amphidinium_carterae.1